MDHIIDKMNKTHNDENFREERQAFEIKIDKFKDREKKLMKLLSAIMEKGIDIEKIYISEVMSKV